MVDYVCKVARRQEIFYLWRPLLKDPKDEMVAEVAIAADCEAVVTHNIRDFGRLGEFAVEVVRPRVFLARLRGKR